jgi:hypothetical protein
MTTEANEGHKGVKLNREEQDKIACWIDLLVPYCGDYLEAANWTPPEREKYRRYYEKRQRMEAQERQNLQDYQRRKAAVAQK